MTSALNPSEELHRTAVHEAGHAVAYYLSFERAPERVTIIPEPEEGTLGHVLVCDSAEHDEADLEPLIVYSFAGAAAEVRFAPDFVGDADGALDDEDHAHRLLVLLRKDADLDFIAEAQPYRTRADELASSAWPSIERLARELIQHGTLDGDEIALAIDIPRGEATEEDLAGYRALRASGGGAGS